MVELLHRERPLDVILSEDLAGSGLVRRETGIPHLAFLHGLGLEHVVSYWADVESFRSLVRYLAITLPEVIYYALVHEHILIRRATLLGSVNRRQIGQLRRWYGVPETRLRFLPYWVDLDRFTPNSTSRSRLREALGLPADAFVFLTASVLTRQKGVHVALEAFAHCRSRQPSAVLLVVGDGPFRARLESNRRALGLGESVKLVGEVPPGRMPDYFAAADGFVFPTLRMESTGIVLLEAMASGLPVVASRIAAVPEVVGNAGLLVQPGDVAGLAKAMSWLMADKAMREQLAAQGSARVAREHDQHHVIARIEATCRELAGGRP